MENKQFEVLKLEVTKLELRKGDTLVVRISADCMSDYEQAAKACKYMIMIKEYLPEGVRKYPLSTSAGCGGM